MGLSRRNFLKGAAGGGLVLASQLNPVPVLAREPRARLPEAVGILYDANLCIGCKACMTACKEYNDLPVDPSAPGSVWDDPLDLSAKTFNIVKLYQNGTGLNKDQELDGYSFVRRFCMHCVDPACTSACPVSALHKDPVTGIVKYNKDLCIGCRYCQVACPFNVPKFQWESAFPQIKKCQLCEHRMAKGRYAACCEFCPNGASIFGEVQALRKEAKRRLTLPPGSSATFPLHRVDSGEYRYATVSNYIPKVFGEVDGGGTQVLLLAGVPFGKLGLPDLPEESNASHSETLMHYLYKGMIGPYVILGGLFYLIYKNTSKQDLP
jgi:Fe-S-cluster-containing dehydrogenase component